MGGAEGSFQGWQGGRVAGAHGEWRCKGAQLVGSEVGVLCILGIEAGYASYECIRVLEEVPRGRELRLRPRRLGVGGVGHEDGSHRLRRRHGGCKCTELGMRIM